MLLTLTIAENEASRPGLNYSFSVDMMHIENEKQANKQNQPRIYIHISLYTSISYLYTHLYNLYSHISDYFGKSVP